MKVAISSDGQNIDATIHERFGRCPYFLLVETDDMSCEAFENAHAELSTGAGIQAAVMLVDKGAKAVVTGNCGPKAMQVFEEAGIPVMLNQQGGIREVVARFKEGTLTPASRSGPPERAGFMSSDARPVTGMGPGRGLGGGRGMGGRGRGMGMGGGRGMGRRCNNPEAAGTPGPFQPSDPQAREQERVQLQQQAEAYKQQLAAIEARIKALS